jgi:hypothetical protein
MQLGNILKLLPKSALLCSSLLLVHLPATAQDGAANSSSASTASSANSSVIPDAQIEANVLKAFAGAPELTDQKITTTTVYGVVTLSGTVRDEPTRVKAETLASRAVGVKKVVDEMTLATDVAPAAVGTNPNLQSDGTMAPAAPAAPAQPGPAPQASQRSYPSQPTYPSQPAYAAPAPEPYGAQQAGQPVTIPNGSMLRIRINQGLDSKHSQPGTTFDGIALNDVVADGAVAIPRGAAVRGSVVSSKAAGNLGGRAELSLQLTNVTLAGKVFPLVTDQWSNVGPDKTIRTVNNTVGLSALGAIIGAVAGGGAGAAIGAGAGAAAGLGTSAASGAPQALIPPEAILTFHLTQPAPVTTVSQAEMDRLGTGVPAGGATRLVRRVPPPPPGYYPAYPYPAPASYPY